MAQTWQPTETGFELVYAGQTVGLRKTAKRRWVVVIGGRIYPIGSSCASFDHAEAIVLAVLGAP